MNDIIGNYPLINFPDKAKSEQFVRSKVFEILETKINLNVRVIKN